jgi:hypothetical protein
MRLGVFQWAQLSTSSPSAAVRIRQGGEAGGVRIASLWCCLHLIPCMPCLILHVDFCRKAQHSSLYAAATVGLACACCPPHPPIAAPGLTSVSDVSLVAAEQAVGLLG